MKASINIVEGYIPQTDNKLFRLNVILLKQISEELYNYAEQFSIDFKPDYAYETKDIVDKLRKFADTIEHYGSQI